MILSFPDGNGYCSTGLPIRTTSGNEYVTTARHCILNETNNSYRAISGNADVPSGNRNIGVYDQKTAWNEPTYDTTLIDPASNNVAPFVWTGAYGSTNGQTITSVSTSTIGDFVCVSGARSGSNCNSKITDKNAVSSFKGATLAGNVSVTAQSGIASAPGDSGGPVWYASGNSTVIKGTLIGALNAVSCPAGKLYDTASFGNTGCSTKSVYISVTGMLAAFNATIAY